MTFFSVLTYPYIKNIQYSTPQFTRFQHLALLLYQQNGQHRFNQNEIQYWILLFLPLGSSKLDTDTPLFFPKIQYLPLLNIPLLIIMRVPHGVKKQWERPQPCSHLKSNCMQCNTLQKRSYKMNFMTINTPSTIYVLQTP